MKSLRNLFKRAPADSDRHHLNASAWPAVIYAIGDVHGCADLLEDLTQQIVEDTEAFEGERWLIMLGDYIDRGPDSARVLDILTLPPPDGFRRFCLAGNHETMLLAFLDDPSNAQQWLNHGGYEMLSSYGILRETAQSISPVRLQKELGHLMPAEHLDLLRTLPISLSIPGMVFVHAGIRRGVPMQEQSESDLLWIRNEFFEADPDDGPLVIHGHTPGPEPVIAPGRICVDTGAFATGKLTAVRLTPDGASPSILTTAPAKPIKP